jgi:hypothetical protein
MAIQIQEGGISGDGIGDGGIGDGGVQLRPDDGSAHLLAVGPASSGDGVAVAFFIWRWILNYGIFVFVSFSFCIFDLCLCDFRIHI